MNKIKTLIMLGMLAAGTSSMTAQASPTGYDNTMYKNLASCQGSMYYLYKEYTSHGGSGETTDMLVQYLNASEQLLQQADALSEQEYVSSAQLGYNTAEDLVDIDENYLDQEGMTKLFNFCKLVMLKSISVYNGAEM